MTVHTLSIVAVHTCELALRKQRQAELWFTVCQESQSHKVRPCLKKANKIDKCVFLQGLGESGMFLGSSVFFAIADAVAAARRQRDIAEDFTVRSPATPERVRMACADRFTDMVGSCVFCSCKFTSTFCSLGFLCLSVT